MNTNNNEKKIPNGFKQIPEGWKATEIGLIPEDWELKTLEDVTNKLKAGGTPRTTEESYWNGDIPLVKVEDVVNTSKYLTATNLYITEDGLNNSSAYLLPENSLLFTMYGTAGEVAINTIPVAPTQNVLGIIQNSEIDSNFLYYALKFSKTSSLERIVDRTIFKHFTLAKAKRLLLTVPPLPEQKKIAHVLSKIQQAIETQEKIIKTTQELKKALMQKLFTEGLNGEPQKQTDIGPIPESWEVKRIDEVYVFTKKPRNRNLTDYKAIPFIPMELVPDSGIEANTFIIKNFSEIPSGTYFENGDLLLAKITPSFENGKQGIADINYVFGYATTEVIPIKQIKDLSDIHYLFYYLLKEDVRKTLAGKMEGSTGRQRLPKGVVQSTLIPFPKLTIQKKISSIFSKIECKIQINKSKTKNLQELFKNTLNLLMTGQIRVKDIEFKLEETA